MKQENEEQIDWIKDNLAYARTHQKGGEYRYERIAALMDVSARTVEKS